MCLLKMPRIAFIVAAGALSPLVQLLAAGGTQRARTLATDALAALAIDIEDNLSQLSAQLVNLLSYGSGEAKERGLELLWRLRHENASRHRSIAASSDAAELIALLPRSSAAVSEGLQAYALWALSLSIDASNQQSVLEHSGEGNLSRTCSRAVSPLANRHQSLARLTKDAPPQQAVGVAGGITPLVNIIDPAGDESTDCRVAAAAAYRARARRC